MHFPDSDISILLNLKGCFFELNLLLSYKVLKSYFLSLSLIICTSLVIL